MLVGVGGEVPKLRRRRFQVTWLATGCRETRKFQREDGEPRERQLRSFAANFTRLTFISTYVRDRADRLIRYNFSHSTRDFTRQLDYRTFLRSLGSGNFFFFSDKHFNPIKIFKRSLGTPAHDILTADDVHETHTLARAPTHMCTWHVIMVVVIGAHVGWTRVSLERAALLNQAALSSRNPGRPCGVARQRIIHSRASRRRETSFTAAYNALFLISQ